MADRTLEPLSFLDTSFLALDSRTTHMHVGSVAIFEGGGLVDAAGSLDVDRIRRFIEARLHYVPRYRQHLAWIPIERYPVWVDDQHFNLEYHVRHTSLPQPGSLEELKSLAGRIMSNKLDQSKPLWELWFVEGLADGRFALIAKIHHCMIDGMSGVDLMTVMMSMVPDASIAEVPQWRPRPEPTGAELLVGDVARRLRGTLDRMASTSELRDKSQEAVASLLRRGTAVSASLASGWLKRGDENPLNKPIGPNRRFTWADTTLEDAKTVRHAFGASINDVVLTTVAGTVRKFLSEHRGMDVSGLTYRVMAPVSVRKKDQRGTLGNQVAMWLVNLPVSEPDPVKRIEAVKSETQHLKRSNQALGAATLVQMSSGAPLTLVALGTRLAAGRRPFATTVTNVPGPQIPLYFMDAELVQQYPLVPLWQHHGYGVAVFSYNGRMAWGINSDWDLMPDNEDFVACLYDARDELLQAAAAAG